MKLLYRLFRNKFIKYYIQEQDLKLLRNEHLELAFTDSKGLRWYRMKNDYALPIQRYRKTADFLHLLASNIDGETLEILCDRGKQEIINILKENKGASWSKIASIFDQIKYRRNGIIEGDVIMNVIASQLIREDEEPNPKEIDMKIHQEKINQLSEEAEKGSEFFFALPELNTLFNSQTMSEKDWIKLQSQLDSQRKAVKEALKVYS